jgi:hypothetical protein
MAFQLPTGIPDLGTNASRISPQMPNALEQYGKMLQLRQLAGNIQQQQQMNPLQVQQAQEATTQAQIETQQKQLALKTQQAQNAYWSNPQQFQTSAPPQGDQLARMLGVAEQDPILDMVRGQMKAGVPGPAAIADAKTTLQFRQTAATASQEQQKVLDDAWKHASQILAPIVAEPDQTKRQAMLEQAKPGLTEWSSFDPSLGPVIGQLNAQNVAAFANRIGAEQEAVDYRSKAATAWKQELENDQTANPLLKMQANPTEAFSGDKLPASIAYLQARMKDPDPKIATQATQLLGVANASKNTELAIDRSKKEAAQSIQDGDPNAAAKLLVDGTVAPSQISSARKPEFAQKAFSMAAQLQPGWDARKAEADYIVARSPAQISFFGSAKSVRPSLEPQTKPEFRLCNQLL